jgi:Helix-turn-helix
MKEAKFNSDDIRRHIAESRFGFGFGKLESQEAIDIYNRYWLTDKTIDHVCGDALLRACGSEDQKMSFNNWILSLVHDEKPIETIEHYELSPRIKKILRCMYRLEQKRTYLKELGINEEQKTLEPLSDLELAKLEAHAFAWEIDWEIYCIETEINPIKKEILTVEIEDTNGQKHQKEFECITDYNSHIFEEVILGDGYSTYLYKKIYLSKDNFAEKKYGLIKSISKETGEEIWLKKIKKVPLETKIVTSNNSLAVERRKSYQEALDYHKLLKKIVLGIAESSESTEEIFAKIDKACDTESLKELQGLNLPLFSNTKLELIVFPTPIESFQRAILKRDDWIKREDGLEIYKANFENNWHIEHYAVASHCKILVPSKILEDQAIFLGALDKDAVNIAKLQLIFAAEASRLNWRCSFNINARNIFRYFNFENRTDLSLQSKFDAIKEYANHLGNKAVRITRTDRSAYMELESQVWNISSLQYGYQESSLPGMEIYDSSCPSEKHELSLKVTPGGWVQAFTNNRSSLVPLPIDALLINSYRHPLASKLILDLIIRRGGKYTVRELFENALTRNELDRLNNDRIFRCRAFSQIEKLQNLCLSQGWTVKGSIPERKNYKTRLESEIQFLTPSQSPEILAPSIIRSRLRKTPLGDSLKSLRVQKGWTQADLGRELSFPQSKVSKIENGNALSRQNIERIERFLAEHEKTE